jgi:predicted PurR-regulated permease PerM
MRAQRVPTRRTSRRAVDAGDVLPSGVRIASDWSWRILVITAAVALLAFVIVELHEIVIPVMVAVIVAALLVPFKDFLLRHRWPRWAAIAVAELSIVAAVGGLLYLVITQMTAGFGNVRDRAVLALDGLRHWLADSPLKLTDDQLDGYLVQGWKAVEDSAADLVRSALSVGSTFGHVLVGLLLVLFTTLFILIDGKKIWSWLVRLFPRRARPALDGAGHAGWSTLRSFVRVQILVALIDAVGIGAGAALLGVPLAVPIGVLVFLGSFIPIVGAVATGVFAVFIALVYNGWVVALVMLGVVLLVQQVEGHVLQPLIMGNAVKIHPLAVVLAVATGSMLAGIAGAFFAVPVAAVLNVMITHVAAGFRRVKKAAARPLVA